MRFESRESYLGERPSPFLAREILRIKDITPGLGALDIACGEGRNSIFLAQHGFRVVGLDISDAGLAKGVQRAQSAGVTVDFRRVDLDTYAINGTYDLILNFNFLVRDLIPTEIASLNPGGILLLDTIMASDQMLPARNPSYLLQPGELARLFDLYDGEVLILEEVIDADMPTARIMFRKN
ncbi:MAG: methyltransferase domain-containing protein [Desulfuromonadaceae bacterium]|nr:methyltransferase domain-containing protein [Desulfuromonadaceae bacterium]